jgi:hypothetical protein
MNFEEEIREKIKANSPYIYWHNISQNYLSEAFIRDFQDKLCWECISFVQKLSKSFLKEFQHKVIWEHVPLCYSGINLPKSWKTFL